METGTHNVRKIFTIIIGCIVLLFGGILLYITYLNGEDDVSNVSPQIGEYIAPEEDFIAELVLISDGGGRFDFAEGETATTNYSVSGGIREDLVIKMNESLGENGWDISRVVPVDSLGGNPAHMIFASHPETQANLQIIIITEETTHQVALMYPNKK